MYLLYLSVPEVLAFWRTLIAKGGHRCAKVMNLEVILETFLGSVSNVKMVILLQRELNPAGSGVS